MTKQPKEPKPPKPPLDVRFCHHCNGNRAGVVTPVLAEHIIGDQAREIEVLAWVCSTCGQPRFNEADQ